MKLNRGEQLKIEREITNGKLKEFIMKSCELNEGRRLSKKDL